MPKRTPDQGSEPFEFRPGVGGFPALGGMFRAGDPATIPDHKHHLVVNCRIKPEGLETRPGLTSVHDSGVEECIVGLTSEPEDVDALLIYPGAPEGLDLGGSLLNPMTFRALWPVGGDLTYSEYVAVAYATPSKETVPPNTGGELALLSKVIEPVVPAGSPAFDPLGVGHGDVFIYQGRACQFMVVDKPDGDDPTPALALVSMDLPKRTMEDAADAQRAIGAAAPETGDPPDLFPHDYPLGSSKVLFYPASPFSGGQAIQEILDAFVYRTRSDSPIEATPGVREYVYFLMVGDAGSIAVCSWDGTVQRTVMTKAGLDLGTLWPILGGQAYGCFVVGSTDGAHGDYAGYENADGGWQELAQGIIYTINGDIGDPEPPPGEFEPTIHAWGAYKESLSGAGVVAFIGEMPMVYSGSWVPGRGAWAFQFGTDSIETIVATFQQPKVNAVGLPVTYPEWDAPHVFPVENLGLKLTCVVYNGYEADEYWVWKHDHVAGTEHDDDSGASKILIATTWAEITNAFWLRNVGGRLYGGGLFYNELAATSHSVFDLTYTSADEVFRGPVLEDRVTAHCVSKGCLPGIPSAEFGEGYAAQEDA